jgi:hypothetical protein
MSNDTKAKLYKEAFDLLKQAQELLIAARKKHEQQPAEGEDIMVNTPYDVFTLPLQPSGLSSGPRFVVHVPGPEHKAYAGCTIWRGSLRISVTETEAIERRKDADEAFCDLVQRALDSLAAARNAAARAALEQEDGK